MDGSSATEDVNGRGEAGNLQHEYTADLQTGKEFNNTRTTNSEVNHTVQGPEMVEQQQNRAGDESIAYNRLNELVGGDDGDEPAEKERGMSEQERLIVKMKYRCRNATNTQVPKESHSHNNPPDYTIDDVSTKEVKQELASGAEPLLSQKASPPTSTLRELQAPSKSDRQSADHDGNHDKPLNHPKHALGQVDFIKQESESKERQKASLIGQAQSTGPMDVGTDHTDDAMHVSSNDEAFSKLSDTVARGPSKDHHGGKELADAEHREHEQDSRSCEDEVIDTGLEDHNLQQAPSDGTPLEQSETDTQSEEDQFGSQEPRVNEDQLSETHHTSQGSDSSESVHEQEDSEKEEAVEANHHASRSVLNGRGLWSQRHQLFGEDPYSMRTIPVPPDSQTYVSPQIRSDRAHEQYEVSRHASQQSSGFDDRQNLNLEADYQRQNIMRIERQRRQIAENLYAARQRSQQMPGSFEQRGLNMPAIPMAPMNYQNIPPGGYRYPGFAQYPRQFQRPDDFAATYGSVPPNPARRPYPSYGYNMPNRPSLPLTPDDWLSGPHIEPVLPTIERPPARELLHVEEISDDDEPLKTRVKRRPSAASQGGGDPVIGRQPSAAPRVGVVQDRVQGHNSEVEFVASRPNLRSVTKKAASMQRPLAQPMQTHTSIGPSSSSAARRGSQNISEYEAQHMAQHPDSKQHAPLSPRNSAAAIHRSSPSENEEISWKLPTYEAKFEQPFKKDDPTIAKVSLPGLVREELILSADHADQETRLLLNIFLPGQQALAVPDPAPAQAVLNFHTIAVMVIEAFVQFEIGDEFGRDLRSGRRAEDEDPDAEPERIRDAKEADVDEIFFAIIDRWRAGLESNKKPLLLIRGAQEFCDVALEIIYYIKEYGLLKPEPKARRVRSDKGTKRGARKGEEEAAQESGKSKGKRKVDEMEESKADQGVKRRGAQKVNTLQPRKKAKTEKPTKTKTKTKSKPEITVIRRK